MIKINMKLLLFLLLYITTGHGGARLKSSDTDVTLSLKGHPIPTDGSGIVIFQDIGGFLGPADGLICSANSSTFAQYWSFPNGSSITLCPSHDVFGTSKTCEACGITNGESLYYSGMPKERGQFKCILEISPIQHKNVTFNIVDMNIVGPNLTRPGDIAIAGEDVELSINVTTVPEDIHVPYQWSVNGTNLQMKNSSRYRGIQADTLTISNVQVEDQGTYACSVANSPSGININSTKPVVVDVKVQVSGSTNNPETAKSYTLNCAPSGVEPLINILQPEYAYSWLKDGQPFSDTQSTPSYTFDSLKFDDAGLYQCLVHVTFNRRLNRVTANGTSPPFQLTYQAVAYRIYLNVQSDCHQWTSTSNMPSKLADVTSHIIQGIQDQTECNQIQDTNDIIRNDEHAFKCPTYPKETVVYTAQIHGNNLTNTSILVSCLNKWIQLNKTRGIVVNEVDLEINKQCTKVVNDVNSSLDCGQKPNKKLGITRDKYIAIGFGILSAILAIIIFIIIARKRCRRCGYTNLEARGQQR